MELWDKVLVILGGVLLLFMIVYVIIEYIQKIKKKKEFSAEEHMCKNCRYGEEMKINHNYYKCTKNNLTYCKPNSSCNDFCFKIDYE